MKKKKNRGGFGKHPLGKLSHQEEYREPNKTNRKIELDRKRREVEDRRKLEEELYGWD